MCIICQTALAGAAAITGLLPAAVVPERPSSESSSIVRVESIDGQRCTRAGLVRTVGGIRFGCERAGKQLRWRQTSPKGAVATNTNPTVLVSNVGNSKSAKFLGIRARLNGAS
ncbi:MAG: hypothetical protein EBZ68_05365, partial [Actinobacteria bacterium]|nr:hypothetical protein [Actinomycetota bacterium]